MLIDQAVPDLAGLLVAVITALEHGTPHPSLELVYSFSPTTPSEPAVVATFKSAMMASYLPNPMGLGPKSGWKDDPSSTRTLRFGEEITEDDGIIAVYCDMSRLPRRPPRVDQ